MHCIREITDNHMAIGGVQGSSEVCCSGQMTENFTKYW